MSLTFSSADNPCFKISSHLTTMPLDIHTAKTLSSKNSALIAFKISVHKKFSACFILLPDKQNGAMRERSKIII